MTNFQDIFETSKQSFISAFSVCMTFAFKMIFAKRLLFLETILTIYAFQRS